jgi:hypothetical protein
MVLHMDTYDGTDDSTKTPRMLAAHAALIPAANRLSGAHRGWYFAVMVRAAYSRLEGVA